MNRKGFTLIEVILVIAILALLVLILVPNALVLIDKNKEKSCNNLKDNIESAAKMYVTYNKYDLGFTCGSTKEITLQTLIDSGDLKTDSTGKIINPIDDSEISLSSVIEVVYDCNTNTFTYTVDGIECEKTNNSNEETEDEEVKYQIFLIDEDGNTSLANPSFIVEGGTATIMLNAFDHTFTKIEGAVATHSIEEEFHADTGELTGYWVVINISNPTSDVKIYYEWK